MDTEILGEESSKNLQNIWLNVCIYLYFTIPVLIFCGGWLRWYWALPVVLCVSIACVKSFKRSVQAHCFDLNRIFEMKTMVTALVLIMLWVYLSGIGGYCFQNTDHRARNMIFRALVTYDWPVVSHDGTRGLIYYIGFWLLPALVGKLFGLEAGFAAQFVWAVLGVFIVYYLICVYRQKVDYLPILFLFFFSGLDCIGAKILGQEIALNSGRHLEWWGVDFQFSCTTTQLFWVFNQALPAWIATMLIILQKDCKNILFILSLIMLTSIFPFIGLIPVVIYLYVQAVRENKSRWRELFTFQNIVGVVIIGGICFLYLIGNVSGGMITQDNSMVSASEPAAQLLRYLLFFTLEFGIYAFFVHKYHKKKSMLWLISGILIVCPFVKVGMGHDFCMRASIPALFILMLLCMDVFESLQQSYRDGKKYVFILYCAVLLLGAVTPLHEMHKTVNETYLRVTRGESVRQAEKDIESVLLYAGNFSGETADSPFYRYLAKPIRIYSFGDR